MRLLGYVLGFEAKWKEQSHNELKLEDVTRRLDLLESRKTMPSQLTEYKSSDQEIKEIQTDLEIRFEELCDLVKRLSE